MSIRKEQVLLILVVLLAAYLGRSYFNVIKPRSRGSSSKIEFEVQPFEAAALIGSAADPLQRRDFQTEPSETRPLPPRELAFPPRAPLSVCAVPLDPGPDFQHSWLLRQDGAQVVGVTIERGGVSEDSAADPTGAQPVGDAAGELGPMSEEQAAKLYDRIYYGGLDNPEYGRIEPQDGVDLFEIEELKDFGDLELRMAVFSRKKKKLGSMVTFGGRNAGRAINKVILRGTVRNQVARSVRKVPDTDASYQEERLALITDLLERARDHAWIFEIAMQQADTYLQMSGKSLDGLRVMQQVLQAQGDIAGELELLEGIAGDAALEAFKLRGLGVIKARLGLWRDAEADLKEAARLTATDAMSHGALAEFYRSRGRSREGLAAALRAEQTLGSVQDQQARASIIRTILGCRLAVGVLASNGNLSAAPPYIAGCIHYAGGDMASAMASFQRAGSGPDSRLAQLGEAACLANTGKWQEAHDQFVLIADEDPLLRHRALTGLAWIFSRLSQFDTALTYVDRALEAAPGDTYALYLRGRTQRLMGQFAAAEEALNEVLHGRDDFVHAIAEMSLVQVGLASNAVGTDQAAALIGARRFIERAVSLSPQPELELYELQGLRAFGAADPRAARRAFEDARDLAASDEQKGYAKGSLAVVAYSRGRVDESATALQRLERDLGRDSVLGKWSGATLLSIGDHAEKEALGDSFERDDLGALWEHKNDGQLKAKIHEGKLVFDRDFSGSGGAEVYAERVNAVPKARDFLAVSTAVAIGAKHDRRESFVGIGIEIRKGRGGADLSVRIGIQDNSPLLELKDGRGNKPGNSLRKRLSPDLLRTGEAQELELRVVPNGDESSRQLILQVYFNNTLVHSQELKQLTRSTQTELKTILFVTGDGGNKVDVAFDDYKLERRKGKR